jgi:hypothetical protein
MTRAAVVAVCLLAAPASVSAQESESKPKGYWERAKEAFEQLDRTRTLDDVQRLYQQAKAAGETVSGNVLDWAREDLGRIGQWEYRVVALEGKPAEIEARLNEHGRERWECVTLSREKGKWTAVLKRPVESRLRHYFGYVSASDILRLVGGNDR